MYIGKSVKLLFMYMKALKANKSNSALKKKLLNPDGKAHWS